uniref:Uncharacterized protein n=1 Tax=Rhipicephalus zambeziensis TaxID=60191 RepID=A0A224Y6E4_9ACAR
MASAMEVITTVVSIPTTASAMALATATALATALVWALEVLEETMVVPSVVTTASLVHSVSSLASVPPDSHLSLVASAVAVALHLLHQQHRVEVLPQEAQANNKISLPFPAIM